MKALEQSQAHISTTNKYKFISTQAIKLHLESLGWEMTAYSEVRSTKYKGFQGHAIRFTRPELDFGSFRIEAVILNSHNGKSSLTLGLGIFRLVCGNGLMVGKSIFDVKIRHTGDTLAKLSAGLNELLIKVDEVVALIKKMGEIEVTADASKELIDKVLELRFGSNRPTVFQGIDTVRRNADTPNNLWVYLNRVQESAIRGGFKYWTIDDKGKVNSRTVREIKSYRKIAQINQELFEVALKWAA